MTADVTGPRGRYRAQVQAEIKHLAWEQLATTGVAGLSLKAIALEDRPDTLRGSGHDEVAGPQFHKRAEVGDRLGHLPDLLRHVALLTQLAVHPQPDRTRVGVTDGLGRSNGAA